MQFILYKFQLKYNIIQFIISIEKTKCTYLGKQFSFYFFLDQVIGIWYSSLLYYYLYFKQNFL